MIILIECQKEIKSFNNLNTSFNTDLLEINEIFSNNSISTILLYKKNLTKETKVSFQKKRKVKNLIDIDLSKVKEDCIIFYHSDIIDEFTDHNIVKNLFDFCNKNKKHIVLQYSEKSNHIFNFDNIIKIKREEISKFLKKLNRELKISFLL